MISSQSNTTPFNLNTNVVNSSDSALGSLFVTEVYAHGEVVRYSPDADKVGLFIRDQVETDAINYTISDGNGGISVGTIEVELTGINHAPVMLSEQITIYQNSEASLNILANDIDFDGDTIELLSTSSSDLVSVNYTLNGDITIIPNADAVQMLSEGESISDLITYTATDSFDLSVGEITITIIGENDAPIALNDEDEAVAENAALTLNLLSNDYDIDNDDTISISEINGMSVSIGDIIELPSGATLELNPNNTITYDPDDHFAYLLKGESEIDQFNYSVTDGDSTSIAASVSISVPGANSTPVLYAVSALGFGRRDVLSVSDEIDPGDIISLSISGDIPRDAEEQNVEESVGSSGLLENTLADGTEIKFSEIVQQGDSFGSVMSRLAAKISEETHFNTLLDEELGTLIVEGDSSRDYRIEAEIKNSEGGSDNQISLTSAIAVTEDARVTGVLRAFDADAGDVLTYSNTPALNGTVQVDPVTGAFEYIPNPDFSGSDSFSLLVIDSAGAADALQVKLDVAAVPDAPVAGDDSNQVWSGLLLQVDAEEGLLVNDYDVDPGDTLTTVSYTHLTLPTTPYV